MRFLVWLYKATLRVILTAPRFASVLYKRENYTVLLKQQPVSSPVIYCHAAVIWTLTATSVILHVRITKKIWKRLCSYAADDLRVDRASGGRRVGRCVR